MINVIQCYILLNCDSKYLELSKEQITHKTQIYGYLINNINLTLSINQLFDNKTKYLENNKNQYCSLN